MNYVVEGGADKTLPLVFCGIYGFYHCVVTGLVVTTVNNSHPSLFYFILFFCL